ncbi:MAG: universal stress protein [Myxococcales bacterium]|nr:universal stress protein [Myxococcales bacterium]
MDLGPFSALLAVCDGTTNHQRSVTCWTDLLRPLWAATLVRHLARVDAESDAKRLRSIVERLEEDLSDRAVLAMVFDGDDTISRGHLGLRCSTLVRPSTTPPKRVLVALSRPDHRTRTLQVATWIAARCGAELLGVHVVANEGEASLRGAIIAANVRVETVGAARKALSDVRVVVDEDVSGAIERSATELGADLLVVGARRTGRGGVVSRALANRATRPTLTVMDTLLYRWSIGASA